MPRQFQEKLLNFMESGHIKVGKIKGVKVFATKTSSYTMDAVLVIDGYNRLLCIDVYLPDYGSTSSMRPNHICK